MPSFMIDGKKAFNIVCVTRAEQPQWNSSAQWEILHFFGVDIWDEVESEDGFSEQDKFENFLGFKHKISALQKMALLI